MNKIRLGFFGAGLSGKCSSIAYLTGRHSDLINTIDPSLTHTFSYKSREFKAMACTSRSVLYYRNPKWSELPDSIQREINWLENSHCLIWVFDRQYMRLDTNLEEFENLTHELKLKNKHLSNYNIICQANKSDLKNILTIDNIISETPTKNIPIIETCAKTGEGLHSLLDECIRSVTSLNIK